MCKYCECHEQSVNNISTCSRAKVLLEFHAHKVYQFFFFLKSVLYLRNYVSLFIIIFLAIRFRACQNMYNSSLAVSGFINH